MATPAPRYAAAQKLEDILACGPDFILDNSRSTLRAIAKHVGLATTSIHHHITSENELIRQLCLRHLNEVFDAVCAPADWHGVPTEVLRAMGLALLGYAGGKASRHLVFLLYQKELDEPARNTNATLVTYLTNNFQLALHNVLPNADFAALHSPARMFLGQIMHLPLWWPAEPHISKDEWLCHLIGDMTGATPPDWREPAARRIEG